MKVYVDELPKDDCPCNRDGRCRLLQEGCYVCYFEMEKNENCPLQSLADYTKQVRKDTFDKINSEYAKRLSAFIGTKISVSTAITKLDEVLDQIQGDKVE